MPKSLIIRTEYGAKIELVQENTVIFLYSSPIRVTHSGLYTFDDFIKFDEITGFIAPYKPFTVANLKRFDTLKEFENDELPTSDRGCAIEYQFNSDEYGTAIYSYETLVMYIAHMIDDTGHFKHILCLQCDYLNYSRTTTKLLKYVYEHCRLNAILENNFGCYQDFRKMLEKEGLY